MKNVLTGCSVVGGLAIVGIGLIFWVLIPAVGDAHERVEQALTELAELDARHPYDADAPVDPERFAASLAARAALLPGLEAWRQSLAAEDDEGHSASLSEMSAAIQVSAGLYEQLAGTCREQALGGTEFSQHVRLLWAALASVATGAGGPEFDGLRTLQPELREALVGLRRRDDSVRSLAELVGEFAPAQLASARDVLARNPDSLRVAPLDPNIEVLLLGLADQLEERA